MINNIERKRAICILGMHRSGTSTITRGLNLLGAYLGEEEDLMIPLPDNPEGYWERPDIYYLQERMLAVLKRDWATASPLPEGWRQSDEINPLKDELAELVKKNFLEQPLWAWKDPRTCLLLPLWKDLLADLAIELKVVFVVRNPLDVARSLAKRDGFTLDKGFGIWFNYTIAALQGVKGLETVFLSYDRFMDDWEAELKKCADGLTISWPADEVGLRAKISSFLRPDMRHSSSGLNELFEVNAPPPVIRLYELLQPGYAPIDSDTHGCIEAIYSEFLGYARLFESDIDLLANYRTQLDDAAHSPEALPKLMELQKDLDMRTQWALQLNEEVKVLREECSSLKLVEQSLSSPMCDHELQAVLDSISWKITKPLRVLHGLFLGARKDR